MRIKRAEIQNVEGKYLCTGCLTRYDSWELAIKCVGGHNQKIYEQIEEETRKFDKFVKSQQI